MANLPGGKKRIAPVVPAGPPFPEELDYLWGWFGELAAGLSSNGFGPPLVTWEAIAAWQRLADIGPIEPWEARTLVQLGMLRAGITGEQARADKPQRTKR